MMEIVFLFPWKDNNTFDTFCIFISEYRTLSVTVLYVYVCMYVSNWKSAVLYANI